MRILLVCVPLVLFGACSSDSETVSPGESIVSPGGSGGAAQSTIEFDETGKGSGGVALSDKFDISLETRGMGGVSEAISCPSTRLFCQRDACGDFEARNENCFCDSQPDWSWEDCPSSHGDIVCGVVPNPSPSGPTHLLYGCVCLPTWWQDPVSCRAQCERFGEGYSCIDEDFESVPSGAHIMLCGCEGESPPLGAPPLD